VEDLLELAEAVDHVLTFGQELAQVAHDRAEVLACRDHAPTADRMEAHRDGVFGQQGGGLFGAHFVRVIDADDEVARAVRRPMAVGPGSAPCRELVGAEDALGAEVARAHPVGATEDARRLLGRHGRQAGLVGEVVTFQGLRQHRADVAGHRQIGGERLVRAFEDDDVLLAPERADDGRLREGADHVQVDRADPRVACGAEVVDGGFDVLRRRAERQEDRVGIFGAVLAEHAVASSRERGKLVVGLFEEAEDGLVEVVAACDHAVRVVLLVLHGAHQDRVLEVDDLRDATARRPKELALRLGGAVDHVRRAAQVLADELRLGLVEGPLQMRREEAVLDVHAGRQGAFGHAAQDEGLIGGLLRVAGHEHDPARVEGGIDVVVAAVDVERVLRQGPGRDFHHHRRELAGGVIVLLDAVDDALARREVHDAVAGHGVGDGPALGGVLALRLDRQLGPPKDVELALREGELEELPHLGRGGDGIEDAGVGESRLGVVADELVAVADDANAGIPGLLRHGRSKVGWAARGLEGGPPGG